MKTDIFNYQYEKNLEIYFDRLELLERSSDRVDCQHSCRNKWAIEIVAARDRNQNLDEKFYGEMWCDQGMRYVGMLDDICNRPHTTNRVIRQSSMNEC